MRAGLRTASACGCTTSRSRRVRASSQALVAFDGSRYSVPVRHAGASLWVRAYATTVEIWSATVIVASHPRATRKGTLSTDF